MRLRAWCEYVFVWERERGFSPPALSSFMNLDRAIVFLDLFKVRFLFYFIFSLSNPFFCNFVQFLFLILVVPFLDYMLAYWILSLIYQDNAVFIIFHFVIDIILKQLVFIVRKYCLFRVFHLKNWGKKKKIIYCNWCFWCLFPLFNWCAPGNFHAEIF